MGFIGTVITFFIAVIVIAVIVATIKTKSQLQSMKQIQSSPKFKAIADFIFENGRRPSRIVITFSNEVFFGPVEGRFVQVPGHLVPSMSDTERHALGGAFEKQYAYSYRLCNSGLKSGFGAAPADTGVDYIDHHADCLLIGSGGTGNSW